MAINKDKVRGMFLGCAIGDAIGMPCEGWSAEKIKETHGRITTYLDPQGHKYHSGNGMKAGAWTDDAQLTLSVAESLVESNGFDLDSQVVHHIKAYNSSTSGWGKTTREALAKLVEGVHWKESGLYNEPDGDKKPKGFGNGVSMKAAPIGAYLAAKAWQILHEWPEFVDKLADFSAMTHRTSMAVSSCIAHVTATYRCIGAEADSFDKDVFIRNVVNASALGKNYFKETLKDDITNRFKLLSSVTPETSAQKIIEDFGDGNYYYVYHSLPFTYAFFLRNPTSIDSLYDCASAGGDTDSNASMLGTLLGALNGTAIFPKELVDGLDRKNDIIKLADSFSERFGI